MRPKKKKNFELTEYGKQRQVIFNRRGVDVLKEFSKLSDSDKVKYQNIADQYKEQELERERSFKLVPEKSKFKNKLKTAQIKMILDMLNVWLFVDEVNVETFTNALNCKPLENSIKVKNNRLLAYTFDQLEKANFIAYNWQDVIDCNKIFCSKNGKTLNKYDLANAKKEYVIMGNPINSDKIDGVIRAIIHL